ncbi:MAG: molecular chaperone SurA [Lysobacterales bacterium RIFOXYD1_FULL_69_11]|nr:MAG: molecular chaperone SurA [Xanthomonadales bacterium RIFOXYA1_FULL_69_10]OHE87969.1 MAG: molecular chaperone SurA [Xanthomonadales bacterium RIFOXYD1_FULL_69_11]
MKISLACVLAATLMASPVLVPFHAHAQAPAVQPIEGIVAVVDEDVVLRSELDRAMANILSQYAGRENQLPPREVLERQVIERLVLVKLQVARANATGVRVSDQEVDQAVAGIAGQNGLSVEQLSQQLARDGSTFAEFRSSIRDELTIQRLRQRFAQSRVSVSEAEIDAAMEAQQGTGQQYRLAHILVAVPEAATPEQLQTAQEKIEGVKSLLDRGEMDFAAAAVRYSDSPNALEGGELGWRSLDEIPTAFAQLVRGLQPGQVSAPLRGPSGFQLLQLVEVRDASQGEPSMVTQYRASHILVRVGNGVEDAEAKASADTLRARIAGGADFAEVARESSQDTSSQARGGDLGWFTRDQFGPEFGTAVAALADGEVSQPLRTEAGWHIIQRQESRQADIGDSNRRAQVSETIGRRKLEDEWNRFLREIRGEAFVDVRVGQAAAEETQAPATGG